MRRTNGGYRVTTNQDEWLCETVVVATGAFNVPHRPPLSDAVPSSVTTLTPFEYKNPDQLAEGGVLVVGASATGVQIACEVQLSGRQVTLAVGEHVRGPRDYRGRDIHWWMEAARESSMSATTKLTTSSGSGACHPCNSLARPNGQQLRPPSALTNAGVKLVGRLAGISGGRVQFFWFFAEQVRAQTDLKLGRLLDTIDEWTLASGLDDSVPPPYRFPPTVAGDSPPPRTRSRQW